MVYVLVMQHGIHDREKYEEYVKRVVPLIEDAGGRVVAVDDNVSVVEGDWSAKRTIILTFPSLERARDWYESPEYRDVVRLRLESVLKSEIVFVHGFGEASSATVH